VKRDAVGKVERWLDIGEGGHWRRRRRSRRNDEEGMILGDSRGINSVSRGTNEGERGRRAVAAMGTRGGR
jgi:hypothetical protein